MKQQEFGGEARTESSGYGVFAGRQGALLEPFLKDEENGGAGEIADVAEDVPGRLGVALTETELLLDVAEEASAAGVEDPAFDVLTGFAVALEEAVDEIVNAFADHLRDVFGEEDVESGITEVEAHGAEGIGEGIGFGDKDPGTGAVLASDDDGGGAIAEEDGGNEIGLGDVLALESKGGELDGDDEDVGARVGLDEIRGAGDGHGTGGATKLGERHATDIGAKAHQVD